MDVLGGLLIKRWSPSNQNWKKHLWVSFGHSSKVSFKLGSTGTGEQNLPATELTIQKGKDWKKQLYSGKGLESHRIATGGIKGKQVVTGGI